MRKLSLLALLLLFVASAAHAFTPPNSTTVTATISDSGGVVWADGTYTFTFAGSSNSTWPGPTGSGAPIQQVFTGTLGDDGSFSVDLPTNTTITPSGSAWNVKICPLAGVSTSYCYVGQITTTVNKGTQAVSITPNAISISGSLGLPVTAYADAEIAAPTPLGFIYYQPTNATTGAYRWCVGVTGNACTSWTNLASSSAGACPSGAANDIQFTNGTNCVGNTNLTFDPTTGTLTAQGTTALSSIASGPALNNFIQVTPTTVVLNAEETGAGVTIGGNAGVGIGADTGNININATLGAINLTAALGAKLGNPTGGVEGTGTLNAQGLFIQGVAVGTGNGTVTSASFTGGLISVATPTTTPALTVAGTSGGIVYFPSGSTWASSAALTLGGVVLGGGAGGAPSTNAGLSYSAGTLTCGIAGTNGCVISGQGATSGAATITWPAVAGTTSNPVVSSNNWSAPQLQSTIATGTAPFIVASTTNVANLNASSLSGATFASPGTIGGTTPGVGDFSALNCGVLNTTSCVLTGFGGTSGSWTITGPLVAGTTTNALAFSNAIKLPAGTAANTAIQFPDGVNYGFFDGAGNIIAVANGHDAMAWRDVDISAMPSQGNLGWTATSGDPTAALDTNLSRSAAATVVVGNGTQGNASGSLTAATIRANTSFNANGTAGISSSGTLCSGTFTSVEGLVTVCTAVSDARLKTNFLPYTRGLKDIMKLRPSTFIYNEDGRRITQQSAWQTGFIAQNVQDALPEAVGIETHYGVDYLSLPQGDRPIVAALVNAVKEQQKEIEKLKKEIHQ